MREKPLAGQAALVTGANSGIGEAVARCFADAGAKVAINWVAHEEATNAIVEDIKKRGGEAIGVRADVSNEAEVQAMYAAAIRAFGTVDILCANAGLQDDAPFTEMTLQKWNHVITVNLTGQFLCAREAAREFIRRGPRPEVSKAAGKIICMSSVHQEIPWAGHANYATSKGGVRMLMQTMAQELAPHKIRVNAIAPGAIQTPINRSAWDTPQALRSLMTLIPDQRIGQPDDIGRAAVWLASDDSDYVQGTTLFVDGGMTLFPGFATGG
ncbi:MAG: SDR family oxidoreductase [Acidobacteriota bacterium]|nr:SDR family oxidoreductase [Acidobacteriota bacterium]MDE3169909.1 SDR family oxidoreductase [Acidobacteriota bacterium]